MNKQGMTKGRRKEMRIPLSEITIERIHKLYAENDQKEIAKSVTPPTTPVNIGTYLKKVSEEPGAMIPLSIAKAITGYYTKKQKEVEELAKIEAA